jgi:hypothetical protein
MRIFRHSGDQKVHRVGVDSAQKRGPKKDAREDFANDRRLADSLANSPQKGPQQNHRRQRRQNMQYEFDMRLLSRLGQFGRASRACTKLQIGSD